jgi:Tol biopolymer transport system component
LGFRFAAVLLFSTLVHATTIAYRDQTGRVVYKPEGAAAIVVAKAGADLNLSRDGKRLLYTRTEGDGPKATIMLYEASSGTSRDLVTGLVGTPMWSPDGTQIAFLKRNQSDWQIWMMSGAKPAEAHLAGARNFYALVDWTPDSKAVIGVDGEHFYWVGTDGKEQKSIAIIDLYGKDYQWKSSDHLRFQPNNPDRMAMSVYYMETPKGAPGDDEEGLPTVLIYDWKTKKKTVLLNTKTWGHDGEWSPDGAWLYYTRLEMPKVYAIWRMHADGTGQERVVAGEQAVVGR